MKRKEKSKNTHLKNFLFLFDLFSEPILVIDSRGKIISGNKKSCIFFNYTLRKIQNKNIVGLFPDFDAGILKEIKNHKKHSVRKVRANGFLLDLIIIPLKFGRKNIFVLLVRDNSGKIIEEPVQTLIEKYDNLAKRAPIAITRLDAVTDLFEFVNEEFTRLIGYTLDEFNSLSKREIYELVHPDDREYLYKGFKGWVENGFKGVLSREYRIFNKQNRMLWLEAYFYPEFDIKGSLAAVNQIYFDITERKKVTEKLGIFGKALENTTEMICINDLNNRFIFVNRAFEENYGYKEEEILGKEIEIIGSVKNPPEIHNIVFREAQNGGWEGELINKRKDGTEFPVLLSTSPIFDKNGKIVASISIARDITGLKNEYAQVKHSLKEKETLLMEVYHRVKNNMQIISSLLNIQSQAVTEPSTIELFKEAQNRVRMMQLIHEKLYKSQDLSRIDFSLYIRDLISQLRRAYPVSRNVEMNINSEGIFLGVDKSIPCGLIINELVTNAYKYAFKDNLKGEIYIELTLTGDDRYKLVVCDNGAGIPESIDITNAGSLGMVLVSSLTEQLGGTVKLERTQGTKFTILF